MYTIEQHELKKAKNQAKKRVTRVGMTLEESTAMKRKFTYRELTLLIGILVAVIIATTVLMGQATDQQVFLNNHYQLPGLSFPTEGGSIKETFIQAIF